MSQVSFQPDEFDAAELRQLGISECEMRDYQIRRAAGSIEASPVYYAKLKRGDFAVVADKVIAGSITAERIWCTPADCMGRAPDQTSVRRTDTSQVPRGTPS